MHIDNHPKALAGELRKAGREAAVAIEAAYDWYWALDALPTAQGGGTAAAYAMKVMRKRKRVKTDARDA